MIFGRNAVYEVLRAGRRQPYRLLVAEGSQEKGRLLEIIGLAQSKRLRLEHVRRGRLDTLDPGHQGVALEVDEYPYSNLVDILDRAVERNEPPFILILDILQDPQNFGALLRTAEAVGVQGIVLPLRRTVTVTPAVVNSSSGACEYLLIVQVNLAQAIATLKEAGVWVIGLENSLQAENIERFRLDGPLALVVGSEGEGLRPLVRQSCDGLLQLPMRGQVASLNAAVAGSVALYFAWQARRFAVDSSRST